LVDANTVKIGPTGSGTAQTANDVGGDVNDILTDTGTTLQAELDAIQAAVITNAAGADIAADIIAVKAETASILTDTAEIGAAGAGLTGVGLSAAAVDAIWDEVILAGAHGTADSAATYLRQNWQSIVTRVAQCGDAGTASTIDLDAAASAVADFYKGQLVVLQAGTGAGQARTIVSYDGATKIATVAPDWATAPDGDTWFAVVNTGSTVVTDWADGARLDLLLDEILADVTGINGDAMRGTDSAATAAALATHDGKLDTVDANVDLILADTNELQVDDVPGLIAALNNISTAEVNAEVDTALAEIHLDHLFAATYDPAAKPGAADALLNEIVENDGGVSRFTANSLEQAPTGGTNPNVLVDTTIAAITSQTVFTLTAGSNDDDAYNDQAIVLYDASDNDYPSVRKVSDYVQATNTITIDSAPDFTIIAGDGVKIFVTAPGTTAPTAAQIVNEWESQSQLDPTGFHVNVIEVGGTTQTANDNGADINAILVDTNELQTDWTNGGRLDLIIDGILADTGELQTDWANGGRLDLIVDSILTDTNELQLDDIPGTLTTINTKIDTIDGIVDAIVADTNELQTDNIPGTLTTIEGKIDTIDGIVDTILLDTNELQVDDVPGLIAALNNISIAEVATEISDALAVDVRTLPGQIAPDETPTIVEALMLLYKLTIFASTNDGSTGQHMASNSSTVDMKRTVSEAAGTLTRGKLGVGP
jgi:hypothetical protein